MDKPRRDHLQELREWMAVLISVVILGLAAWTIGQTFLGAKIETDAVFGRQKDIMLYVVSLFGTVTGYYLGRVPAEINARRADEAAQVAQQQLTVSQERLGEASASASTAREEQTRVAKRLKQSTSELRSVSEAIGRVRRAPRAASGPGAPAHAGTGAGAGAEAHGGVGGGGGTGAFSIRADEVEPAGEDELLEAKRRIDALLVAMAEEK